MNRSANLALSLLLAVLAPAIVIGSVFAARVETDLNQSSSGSPSGSTNCVPPVGWAPVQAQPGDSLARLATQSGTTIETIEAANCLGREVEPGDFVYLPATPAGSPTPCGPPADWVLRPMTEGETLQDLAQELGVPESELRAANCLGPFTAVLDGVRVYAPPTATSSPTSTPRPTATPSPSATPTIEATTTESATIQAP